LFCCKNIFREIEKLQNSKMSLESLYHATNKRLLEAQDMLGTLTSNKTVIDAETMTGRHREISARIEHIMSNCERLDVLVLKEPPARRHNSKIKVDQLKYDVKHLQSSFQSHQAKQYERERWEREREELLHTKFTTNANSNENGSETAILIDRALEHNSALHRSNRGVDDLLNHGQTILETLRDQRGMMKGIRKKMLDVASMLGMSNTQSSKLRNVSQTLSCCYEAHNFEKE